jgi:hypothetical protein
LDRRGPIGDNSGVPATIGGQDDLRAGADRNKDDAPMGKPKSFRALVWLMVVAFASSLATNLGRGLVDLVVCRLRGE